MEIQFNSLTTLAQLENIEAEWLSLSDTSGNAQQLFQDFVWNSCWWKHFCVQDNYELRVLTGTSNNELILVWPFVINTHWGLRILEPTGGLLSCYDDALVSSSCDLDRVLNQAWHYLQRHDQLDAIVLRAVHDQAKIADFLKRYGGEPISATTARYIDCDASTNFDVYLQTRSRKMRQNQRRSWKYLAEQGEIKSCADDKVISPEQAIQQAVAFKQQWLNARGLHGKTLTSSEGSAFLIEVCETFQRVGKSRSLCIATLYLDERPIAIGVGFRFHGRHYEYLGSFDYSLSQFGPGRLQMELTIRDCFDKSISAYDLLTPDTSYKKAWADDKAIVRQYIVPMTVKGRLYRDVYIKWLRPKLRAYYNALPMPLKRIASRIGA